MTSYNFDFDINEQDLKHASKDVWKVPHFFKMQRIFIALPIISAIVTVISIFMPSHIFNMVFFPLVCMTLFFVYLLFVIYHSTYVGMKKMIKGSNFKRCVVIDDVGIKQTNSASTSTFYWSGVVHIANQNDTILLFIGDRMFILLPKRIFANDEELNNCWSYIQDCYNKAQNKD